MNRMLAGAPRGNVRWLVIFWLFIISAVSYLDRNNLSIAAGSIQQDFGLTDVQLGFVFSAFVFGYALTQPLAGRMADSLGAYKAVGLAIVWWSVFTALTPLVPPGAAHALTLLIIVRLLLGIGEAIIYPAGNRLVASWMPSVERGRANGLIFAGVGIGGGIAPPLVTYLMINYGWHSAFYVSAIIGLVVGAVWLVIVRNRPAEHPFIGEAERNYIAAGLPVSTAGEDGPPAKWLSLLGDRQILLLTASYFCYGYVAYIFFSWFFLYLSSVRGLDLKSSAILAMLPFIAMTVFSILGGIVSDHLERRHGARVGRCVVAGVSLIVASLFVVAATLVSSATLASLILAGGAGSLYFAQSAYWTLSANIGGRSAGAVSGIMNMGAQIGGVVTASGTAIIADAYGWTVSFLAAALICLIGGLLWFTINPDHSLERR
jgi:ACS family glucarate transporter-like MFS transporter